MKNATTLLFLTIFFIAQTVVSSAQVSLGVKAGLNLANFTIDGFEEDSEMLPSFMVGAVVELPFSDKLGLGTGLQYHGKGGKSAADEDVKTTLGYLQIPIQLQYQNNGLFAAVGPYVGFGIAGQNKDGDESEDVSFGSSEDDDVSALDYGVGLEVGYSFGKLRATAGYSLGLANLVPADAVDAYEQFGLDVSIKNTVIGIGLTYLFGQE